MSEEEEMTKQELDAVYRRVIHKGGHIGSDSIPKQDAEFAYMYFGYLFRELADSHAALVAEVDELQQENRVLQKENLDLHRTINRKKK